MCVRVCARVKGGGTMKLIPALACCTNWSLYTFGLLCLSEWIKLVQADVFSEEEGKIKETKNILVHLVRRVYVS